MAKNGGVTSPGHFVSPPKKTHLTIRRIFCSKKKKTYGASHRRKIAVQNVSEAWKIASPGVPPTGRKSRFWECSKAFVKQDVLPFVDRLKCKGIPPIREPASHGFGVSPYTVMTKRLRENVGGVIAAFYLVILQFT